MPNGDIRRRRIGYLLRKQNGRCIWCNIHISDLVPGDSPHKASIEHITPRALGGTNDIENLAVACRPCNTARGRQVSLRDTVPTSRKLNAERFGAMLKGVSA